MSPALWVGFLQGIRNHRWEEPWEDLRRVWLSGVQCGGDPGEGEAGGREAWEETAAISQNESSGSLGQERERRAGARLSFPSWQR